MKTIALTLLALIISVKGFTQSEETAIKKVLTQETTSFFKHDFKASYAQWYIIPQSSGIVSSLDGKVLNLTDKELNAAYTTEHLAATKFPDSFERSNWKFRIRGAAAYVTFDQTGFKEKKIAGWSHEARYMEKISGQWKIVAMTVAEYKK